MEINNDGTVGIDLAEIGKRLDAVGSITDEKRQRHAVHKLQTEILLDVAVSLRVLADEAGRAMMQADQRRLEMYGPDVPEDDTTDGGDDFFVVGDLVRVKGTEDVGTIQKIGIDQGDEYANVYFASENEASVDRYYTRNLERLIGDEKPYVSTETEDAAMIDADDAPELFEGAGWTDPAENRAAFIGDIDSDFDGDHHPGADDAVAVLAAKEAERKAGAKKKGSKK